MCCAAVFAMGMFSVYGYIRGIRAMDVQGEITPADCKCNRRAPDIGEFKGIGTYRNTGHPFAAAYCSSARPAVLQCSPSTIQRARVPYSALLGAVKAAARVLCPGLAPPDRRSLWVS